MINFLVAATTLILFFGSIIPVSAHELTHPLAEEKLYVCDNGATKIHVLYVDMAHFLSVVVVTKDGQALYMWNNSSVGSFGVKETFGSRFFTSQDLWIDRLGKASINARAWAETDRKSDCRQKKLKK